MISKLDLFPISNSEKKIGQNILTPIAFPDFRGADLTDISVLRLLDQVHISVIEKFE